MSRRADDGAVTDETPGDPNPARPGPLRWLWYAFGGGLPPRYRNWVLHDVTTRTWPLRQMLRSVVQLLPVAALLVLVVPGELWVRLMAVVGGALVGMMYAASFVQQTTEHRAMKAGWPPGYAQEVRDLRYESRRAEELIRYAQRYRGAVPPGRDLPPGPPPPSSPPPGSPGPSSPGPSSPGPGSG
jgi:hypothetical protein